MHNFMEHNKLTIPLTKTLVLILTWIVKTSTKISIQSEDCPNALVGDGRSMQNGINITKSSKQDNKYGYINQLNSCQKHFLLFNTTTAQHQVLVSFSSGFDTCDVLRGKFVSPSHNIQPDGPGLSIHGSGEKMTQLCS